MDPWLFSSLLAIALVLTLAWGSFERRRRLHAGARLPEARATPSAVSGRASLFPALAAAMDDGLMVVEPDRRISFANDAAGKLLGIPGSTMRGKTAMVGLRDYEADQAVERTLTSGEPQSLTLRAARSGRTLRLTCQPYGDQDRGALVLLRDLTHLAQLERARREMVANVSHELRTPLASIRLLVETLTAEPPAPVARRMLGQIDDELAAMTQLVDELRELSQIESGRLILKLRPTSIPDLAGRALERLAAQAERRGLRLRGEFPPDLADALVDEDRLQQVLMNLLHNAIKFTPEGGTISVSALPAVPPPDDRTARELRSLDGTGWLKVTVHDSGIGIPPGEIDRVFERFYKVDRARTRDSGGTGLGLAISKHLIEQHGGRIWAESREGRGSSFSMLVPTA